MLMDIYDEQKKKKKRTVTTPTFKRLQSDARHAVPNSLFVFYILNFKFFYPKCKTAIICCLAVSLSHRMVNIHWCGAHVLRRREKKSAGKEREIAAPIAYECIFHEKHKLWSYCFLDIFITFAILAMRRIV